jgi:hypothetical protein
MTVVNCAGQGDVPTRSINQRSKYGKTMLKYTIPQTAAGVAWISMILASSTGPSLAQEWTSFGIRKACFIFDVPPGFSLDHIAEDGQAATFLGPQDANLVVRVGSRREFAIRLYNLEIQPRCSVPAFDGWDR